MPDPSRGAKPIQTSQKFHKNVDVRLDYLLYLPTDYEHRESWPLILFLHGSGERGSDVERVKAEGLPKLLEHGKSLPFIVASPQCPEGDAWVWHLTALLELIDELSNTYKVDPDRISVTGLSLGAFGTWGLAAYRPDRFAAIVPICGGGESTSMRRLKNLPVWAFHGAKDPIVPIARTQELVDVLTKAQGNVKFTTYPDAEHDSWMATYENPELYTWLLEQKRTPPTKKTH